MMPRPPVHPPLPRQTSHGRRSPRRASCALRSLAIASALHGAAVPAAAHPQDVADGTPVTAAEVTAREAAGRAQAAFERRRRAMLPRSNGGGGRCDVRLGRYCYWYDESAWPGPPEPPRVAVERRRLLMTLDSAAVAAPSDDWIAGQRVRYWLEAGAADTALAAARECAGSPWWCAAITGWAVHAGGDAAGAAVAFDSALAAMPEEVRCRWRDISLLLDDDTRDRYSELGCREREATERRFWWLATPFFARGGNDRRNEHFARHALARLARESPTAYDFRWGEDMEELLLRYGWAERWSRHETPLGSYAAEESVIGHEPIPAYSWAPAPHLLDEPFAASSDDWAPRASTARARFAPAAARHLSDLRASAALFRRGDSTLVIGTFRVPDDTLLAAGHAAVILSREGSPPLLATLRSDSAGGVARVIVPTLPHLMSIELLTDSGHAARARFAVAPPSTGRGGSLALSDLLPYRTLDDGDTTLEAASRLAVRADELTTPGRVAIYWEMYGLTDGRHELETSLSMVSERAGWLTRLWRRARGDSRAAPVSMRWTDVPLTRAGVPSARAVALDLPELPSGRYVLRLTVRDRRSGAVAEATRTLDVVR